MSLVDWVWLEGMVVAYQRLTKIWLLKKPSTKIWLPYFFMNRNRLEGVIEEKLRVVSLELVRVVVSVGSTVDSDAWQVSNMNQHHLSIFLRNHRMCIVAYAIVVSPISPSVQYNIMEAATTLLHCQLQRTEGAGPDPARNSLVI
jgi:hypothetical protein